MRLARQLAFLGCFLPGRAIGGHSVDDLTVAVTRLTETVQLQAEQIASLQRQLNAALAPEDSIPSGHRRLQSSGSDEKAVLRLGDVMFTGSGTVLDLQSEQFVLSSSGNAAVLALNATHGSAMLRKVASGMQLEDDRVTILSGSDSAELQLRASQSGAATLKKGVDGLSLEDSRVTIASGDGSAAELAVSAPSYETLRVNVGAVQTTISTDSTSDLVFELPTSFGGTKEEVLRLDNDAQSGKAVHIPDNALYVGRWKQMHINLGCPWKGSGQAYGENADAPCGNIYFPKSQQYNQWGFYQIVGVQLNSKGDHYAASGSFTWDALPHSGKTHLQTTANNLAVDMITLNDVSSTPLLQVTDTGTRWGGGSLKGIMWVYY